MAGENALLFCFREINEQCTNVISRLVIHPQKVLLPCTGCEHHNSKLYWKLTDSRITICVQFNFQQSL